MDMILNKFKFQIIFLGFFPVIYVIASLSDIPMFYIEYLTMHKVHMYAGVIRQLLYGCAYVREIIHFAIAHELSSRTHAQTIR